jgi:hypothetical protein
MGGAHSRVSTPITPGFALLTRPVQCPLRASRRYSGTSSCPAWSYDLFRTSGFTAYADRHLLYANGTRQRGQKVSTPIMLSAVLRRHAETSSSGQVHGTHWSFS